MNFKQVWLPSQGAKQFALQEAAGDPGLAWWEESLRHDPQIVEYRQGKQMPATGTHTGGYDQRSRLRRSALSGRALFWAACFEHDWSRCNGTWWLRLVDLVR